MFTGLIENCVSVVFSSGHRLGVQLPKGKFTIGESLSLDGVCLTLVKKGKKKGKTVGEFDLSPETLQKTTLGTKSVGQKLNFERTLTLNKGLGGHLVQGHVDGIGKLVKKVPLGENWDYYFGTTKMILATAIPKGSITVNGVSLTIVDLSEKQFSVALIPHTLKETNLGSMQINDPVNIETDLIGKYVKKVLENS